MRSTILRKTKINRSDPPLTAIFTTYATQPLLPFLDPPIERACRRPGGYVNLDRWIYFAAMGFAVLTGIEIAHN